MFTDDELKVVKEELVPLFPHKLGPLIARMEAAEKFCQRFLDDWYVVQVIGPQNVDSIDKKPARDALKEWRKVAGR